MPTEIMNPLPRKLLILSGISLIIAVFGSAVVMLYMGFFTDPQLSKNIAPPYRIAYIMKTGPYEDIDETLKEVAAHLKKAKIEVTTACVVLLDDNNVSEAQRRSKIGYLVGHNDFIPAPLEVDEMPEREVLTAIFDGGSMMGSYQSYGAMKAWAKKFDYKLALPALEIYHLDGKMEYQLSAKKDPLKDLNH
ncbi:MAG: GyrI-like domain-containing protein [Mariprofundaceae bacterium]